MNEKEQRLYDALPAVPEFAPFRLARVTTITEPHLYCITPNHVAYASDHCGGMLTEQAMADAERYGNARCGMRGCQLPYSKHVSSQVAVVVLPNDHPNRLNDIAGLHKWLLSAKERLSAAGLALEGFMFPTERQDASAR